MMKSLDGRVSPYDAPNKSARIAEMLTELFFRPH